MKEMGAEEADNSPTDAGASSPKHLAGKARSVADALGQDKTSRSGLRTRSAAPKRDSVWRQTFKVQPPGPDETPQEALQRLKVTLGNVPGSVAAPIICILGGTTFNDPETFTLVQSLASEMTKQIGKQAVFVTGGMDGVQRTFAESCGRFVKVFNLLPVSETEKGSGFDYGVDIFGGRQLEERKAITADLGDIYITVEGGPNVAGEARIAHARGAALVPLIRSGGASAGLYDFPREALNKPNYATEEQWDLISNRAALPAESAGAAAGIVSTLLESIQVEKAAKANAEKAALKGRAGAPPPLGIEKMDMTDDRYLTRAFEMLDLDHKFVLDRAQARKFLRIVGWTLPDNILDEMLSGATPTRPAAPEKKQQGLFTRRMLFDICEENKHRVNGELDVFREGLRSLADGEQAVKKQYLLDIILAEDGQDAFALTKDEVEQIFRILGFSVDGLVDVDQLADKLMRGVAVPPSGHQILAAKPWTGGGIDR